MARLRSKIRIVSLLGVCVLIVVGVYGYYHFSINHSVGDIRTAVHKKTTLAKPHESVATLQSQLTSIYSGYPNVTESVCLIDLSTNKVYNLGSNGSMIGASTTKVITAADYLNQVQEGNATLSQSLDGTDDSAEGLMDTMIEESSVVASDDAWQDFINYLTPSQITSYAQSIGLNAFNEDTNMISAQDEAIIFQKLFEGKLLNKTNTNLLLYYLQNGGGQDLIPAGLPTGALIYHKYGYLYGYLNDAAVVTYKGQSFVLSIYTNNSNGNLDDNSSREQLFHSITQAVVKFEIS